MGKDARTVIAIDVGTSNVRVVAARYMTPNETDILALGQAPSLGVRRGLVEDIDEASYAIRAALEDAEIDGRVGAAQVCVGIGDKHLSSINHSGEATIPRRDGMVTEREVAQAIQAARDIDLGEGRDLVHHVPCAFRIDGFRCRRNPVGMHGSMALAETHLVSVCATAAKNLKRAVQMAGKDVDYLVANGIAASRAVLWPEEKDMGVIFVDIGGGTTDVVAYSEGAIYHTSVLPLGGNQVANDIAIALNTSFHIGERVLIEHGVGSPDGVDLNQEITIPCFGMAGYRHARIQYLYDVIRLRIGEIMHLAVGQVRRGVPGLPPTAGVVITGGLANLPGIEHIVEQALRMPARVGKTPPQQYAPGTMRNPSFAAILGALQIESDPLFGPVRERRDPARNGLRLRPHLNLVRS